MAQQYGNLSGTVTEWKGAIGIAVSNANVQIITSLNDTLGTVVVGGIFYFKKLPVGKTVIITSLIGKETNKQHIIIIANKEVTVNIEMREKSTQLQEVVVKGKVPIVTIRQDTLIYNAAAVNTMDGDETMKILEQMPGVEAGSNEVSVMGKKITKTYIDGKLIFGHNPLAALKNLPAYDVVNIKVFDEYRNKHAKEEILSGDKIRVLNIETKSKLINSTSGHLLASGGANLNKKDKGIGSDFRKGIGGTGNFFSEKFILTGNAFYNNTGIRSNRINDILNAGNSSNNYQENTYTNVNFEYNKELDNGISQYFTGGYSMERNETTSMDQTRQEYFPADTYQQRSYKDSTYNESIRNNHRVYLSSNTGNIHWGNLETNHVLEFRKDKQYNLQGIENIENHILTSKSSLHNSGKNKVYDLDGRIYYYNAIKRVSYGTSIHYTFNSNNEQSQRIDTLETSQTKLLLSIPANDRNVNINGSTHIKWALDKKDINRMFLIFQYDMEYSRGEVNQIGWNLLNPLQPEIEEANTYSYRNRTLSHKPKLTFNGKIYKNIALIVDASAVFSRISRDEATTDNYEKTLCTPFLNINFMNQSFINNWSLGYIMSGGLPSIIQLRPQVDNSNPYLLRSGNPNLKYTLSHILNIGYNKLYPKTGDMLIGGASIKLIKRQIVGRTTYFQEKTSLPELNYTVPAYSSLISYENIYGYAKALIFCSWRHPIRSMKSRYTLRADFSYLKNPYYIGNEQVTTRSYSPILSNSLLLNITKNINISLNTKSAYTYSNNKEENYKILGQNVGMEMKIDRILKTCYWHATYSFQFLQNFGTTEDITRSHKLNCNIGYKLFKGKADISFCVYDLLNKFKNVKTMMMSNYIETTHTNYFGRYFTINLAWRFNKIKSERSNLSDGGLNDIIKLD